jgi:hypothetical protein
MEDCLFEQQTMSQNEVGVAWRGYWPRWFEAGGPAPTIYYD